MAQKRADVPLRPSVQPVTRIEVLRRNASHRFFLLGGSDMTWKDNEPESSYAHTERRVMTAASDREAEDLALRCPQCGGPGEFGYRDVYRAMRWFCPRHRLAQFW